MTSAFLECANSQQSVDKDTSYGKQRSDNDDGLSSAGVSIDDVVANERVTGRPNNMNNDTDEC